MVILRFFLDYHYLSFFYMRLPYNYTKGHDLFDLFWYLSDPDWPSPNLVMLNHALQQTSWAGPTLNQDNWRQIVFQHLQTLDWGNVINDVQPFLEPGFDIQLLTQHNLETLLIGPE